MKNDVEKRKYYRQRAGLEVTVVPRPDHALPPDLHLVTSDVALEGMNCASNAALEPGTEMRLKLNLVGGELARSEAIDLVGRVLRCAVRDGAPEVRRHGVAIAFVTITPEDRRKLQRYLNSF